MTDRRLTAQGQAGEIERRDDVPPPPLLTLEQAVERNLRGVVMILDETASLLRGRPGCEPSAAVVQQWSANIRPNVEQMLEAIRRNPVVAG